MSREQSILVGILHHPIEAAKTTIIEVPYHHQSLASLCHQFTDGNVLCILDGQECEDWGKLVHANSKVIFVPAVGDVTTLIQVAAAFFTGGVGSFVGNIFWAMAIGYTLSYLGGCLFGQDIKQPSAPARGEESQSFGWRPRTTQREGMPHPMCWGTNMHYGNIVARWTDVDESGSELLYMILDYGRGPVQGKGTNTVYFNNQPSSYYSGVSIQERLGTLNQTAMTGFEKNKLEYRPAAPITSAEGSVMWTTHNNFFDDIEYTLSWPHGLRHHQDDGSQVAHGVGVKVEISVRDAGSWTTLMDATISENQRAPVYKAYSVADQGFNCVHGTQYDLKYTKTTDDKSADRWGDKLVLRSVREVVDVAFTRPGKALLGITALATERLSGHINVKWIADDKLVNVFNGTVWEVKWTGNRAWVYLDEITQPVISGDGGANPWVIERYEGLNPNRVDLAFIYEWAEWCDQQVTDGNGGTEDRMPCNVIVDWQTDVWSLAYEIAQIGRMSPYWQGNVLTGWVDCEVTDDLIDLVTFDNTMVRSWKSGWAGFGEIAGKVEVFFKDAQLGYERKSISLPNEDAGLYTRIVAVEGMGVTGHAFATRVGNHALTRNKLIKNINSVRMYKDALRYRLGRVVRLQNKVPNWGESYRAIESEAANTVKLDRTIDAAEDDIVYVRSYDEANKKVDISSYTVDSCSGRTLTIKETWDVTPIKNNILAVGVAGKIKLRRIIRISHAVTNYFNVTFETYNTDLFNSDDIEPAIDNPNYVWPQPALDLIEPVTREWVVDTIKQLIPPLSNVEVPSTSNITWGGDHVFQISCTPTNPDEPMLFRFRGTTYQITPGVTSAEYIYWDPNYTTVFRVTNVAAIAFAPGNWVMCTNKGGYPFPANAVQLLHGAIIQAGTITAGLGQLDVAVVQTANIKDLAVETLKIKDNAVTVPVSAYTEGAKDFATWTILQSCSITATGQPIQIITNAFITNVAPAQNVTFRLYVYRDAEQIFGTVEPIDTQWDRTFHTITLQETPSVGFHTYYLEASRVSGVAYGRARQRSILLLEVKK